MPLVKSGSSAALSENFHDLRHGKTFGKTERKFGKKRAQKQMVAIALSNQRKYTKRGTKRGR